MNETEIRTHDDRQRGRLQDIQTTLRTVESHLKHRDRINAELHLAEPRWSPLTERVVEASYLLALAIEDEGHDHMGSAKVTGNISESETPWRLKLLDAYGTVVLAEEHHKQRDLSNAALHMDEVRWSPLTEALAHAVTDLAAVLRETTGTKGETDESEPMKVEG